MLLQHLLRSSCRTSRVPRRALLQGSAAVCATAAATASAAALAEPSKAAAEEEPAASDGLLPITDPREGAARYIAYARRAVQAFLVKGRVVAYTSDVGESVRPVVPPWVVRACYGLTWLYVGTDVAFNTSEAHRKGKSDEIVARTAVHTTVFQVVASVLVPSLIIHQAVHVAQGLATKLPKGRIAFWLPSLCGLALIPFMPYVDEPVEHVIDVAFEAAWPNPEGAAHGEAEAAGGAKPKQE